MAYNLTGLTGFIDQTSQSPIVQAVLGSRIMEFATIDQTVSAGTVALNKLTSVIAPAASSCGWNAAGTVSYSQVNVTIVDKQEKEQLCAEDLRSTWISSQLSAGGEINEEVPFIDSIVDLKLKQLKDYVEYVVFNGDGGQLTGLIAGLTAGAGAATISGATAWGATNSLQQAQLMVSAVPTEVLDRPDLIMYMSFASYRALNLCLFNLNLFHYTPGENTGSDLSKQQLVIPGTNVLAVPFAGMRTSNRVFIIPKEYLRVFTGAGTDYDNLRVLYDPFNDILKLIAKFRIGVAVAFPAYCVSNDLA